MSLNYKNDQIGSDIDFVITWVNPNDQIWAKKKKHYAQMPEYRLNSDNTINRFRDWDNFYLWFRGVENFAPWVRKVHLITEGHLPTWLNTSHPKLNIVKHSDYIDENYLPTFNSRVIELSLTDLKGLSERFVLFNDDFFCTAQLKVSDFFTNDLPRDCGVLNALNGEGLSCIQMNDINLINNKYNKKTVISKHVSKWLNYKYGINNLRTLALLPWPKFTGFFDPHLPQPYLKSKIKECRKTFNDEIERTLNSKFRLKSDVNHYLFRYYHLVTGAFYPSPPYGIGRYFSANDANCHLIENHIKNKKSKITVVNDGDIKNFNYVKKTINNGLQAILPQKSQFEL